MTCKDTLRQVFIRAYRLEIQSVMLVFSTQLCELLPISHSLWFNSLPPPPLPVWISILYTRTQCVRGGIVLPLRQINTCRKVPLQVNFFRWQHFALPSMSLILLRTQLGRSEKKTVWRNCSRKCMKKGGEGRGGGEWPNTFRQWQGGMTQRIKIRKKAAGSSGPVCRGLLIGSIY